MATEMVERNACDIGKINASASLYHLRHNTSKPFFNRRMIYRPVMHGLGRFLVGDGVGEQVREVFHRRPEHLAAEQSPGPIGPDPHAAAVQPSTRARP